MLQTSAHSPVNPQKNNIFAFWESPNPMPAYLALCQDTWLKNIPNCDIHVLNHRNLHEYIGDTYDMDKLKTISFAMQSDIISAAVLEKFGGLFLDLDCIVIDDVFNVFNKIAKNKLISFGRPADKAIHLAVLYCDTPNNPVLREWRKEAQLRLTNKPDNYPWHYFGNGIIDPLLNQSQYKDDFYIIDRTQSGNILESAAYFDGNLSRAIADYKNFYFNENFSLNPRVLDYVKCGVISLHNSWTPAKYKEIHDKEKFLDSEAPIAGLIQYILNHQTGMKEYNINILPVVESFILNHLKEKQIPYIHKYFRNMLVVDFMIDDIHFAFDIGIQNNDIFLDFIFRNEIHQDVMKLGCLKDKSFTNNKTRIAVDGDKSHILNHITNIYSMIKDYHTSKSPEYNPPKEYVVDLQKFKLVEHTLYIEGIGILVGQNAKEYADISYKLLIQNESGQYVKNLAKANRPELTALYAHGLPVSYDKCWFATPNYQGVDIADVPVGQYELMLQIKVNGIEKTYPLMSRKEMNIENALFSFRSSSTGNQIQIKKILHGQIKQIADAFQSKLGTMLKSENHLAFTYPNNGCPITIKYDFSGSDIVLECPNESTLKALSAVVEAQQGKISILPNQELGDILLPVLQKTEQFIIKQTKFSSAKLKVDGYYQDEHNNVIDAPFNLQHVHVQFFGKNNRVVLHEKSNLKNTFIEFKGDNATFIIGEKAGIFGTFRLGYECQIEIGHGVTSTNAMYVTCAEKTKISIGDDCMFATNNQIRTDDSHAIYDLDTGKRVNRSKDIVLGNHVWVAYGATIMGGTQIGDGSVVGAFSLVKKAFPNNCVLAGIPAKVVRENVFWKRPLLLNQPFVEDDVVPLEEPTLPPFHQTELMDNLDIFVHAHPDDIELFMGMAAKKAIENQHKVIMLLATGGDGGKKNSLLTGKNGQQMTYPESRLKAHDEAIKYLLGSQQDGLVHSETVNGHQLKYTVFDEQVYSYNLMLPDGYHGVGFKENNFETLEKLYSGNINTITAIDDNHYASLSDLRETIVALLSQHTQQYRQITIHLPENDAVLNKGAHSDHFFVSKLMCDIINAKQLGAVQVKLYSDYINGDKPINLFKDEERFHRNLNSLIDDILIEHGRDEGVRAVHLGFLGKEYVTRSYSVS